MAYIGLALFAEGPTDHRFLRPLLRRACEYLCLRYAVRSVEIGDVAEIHTPKEYRNAERETRIFEAARRSMGSWHLLFIHTDGAGDPQRAKEERVCPASDRIKNELQNNTRQTVGVVPIRETEAWCLADGDALRLAFGTTLSNRELGLPEKAGEVETILDPKNKLDEVYQKARQRRSGLRRRVSGANFLDLIGEYVSVDVLEGVPAFRAFEKNLYDALVGFGYIIEE
ncbi:MAG: DUF4276 family protein [Deltaproteobacteria bacterium]|nr:DUF4276 family protein [Deltaproteobacteria bacterium]